MFWGSASYIPEGLLSVEDKVTLLETVLHPCSVVPVQASTWLRRIMLVMNHTHSFIYVNIFSIIKHKNRQTTNRALFYVDETGCSPTDTLCGKKTSVALISIEGGFLKSCAFP